MLDIKHRKNKVPWYFYHKIPISGKIELKKIYVPILWGAIFKARVHPLPHFEAFKLVWNNQVTNLIKLTKLAPSLRLVYRCSEHKFVDIYQSAWWTQLCQLDPVRFRVESWGFNNQCDTSRGNLVGFLVSEKLPIRVVFCSFKFFAVKSSEEDSKT